MPLRIALLGPPSITVDGQPLVVDTRKAIALLVYLAVVERPVARASLTELLWPEADPEDGRGALRRTLSVLRSALGGRWLVADRRQARLEPADTELDVAGFRSALRRATHVHDPGEACPACRNALEAAVERYRGPFLEGFGLRDSLPFDEWQTLEGEALAGELAAALRRLLELRLADRRPDLAIEAGRRLLALDPLDEAAHRALMRAHAAGGDMTAVDRQLRECARILEAELGEAPAPETLRLRDRLVTEARALSGGRVGPVEVSAATVVQTVPSGADPQHDVLLSAAILGDEVDPDLVRELVGADEDAIATAFEQLVRRGTLEEPAGEGGGYRFASDTERVRAVASMSLARRRVLHRRAAGLLERRVAGLAADSRDVTRLAEHLAAAGRQREAAELRLTAGTAAATRAAHGDAAGHLRGALALGHPDRVAILRALGDAETMRGRYGEALSAYEQGAAVASPSEVAEFEHRLGSLHLRRGALELAELHLQAALSRLDGNEAAPLRARVLADRSLVAVRRDDHGRAERLALDSLAEARRTPDPDAEAQAENLLAMLARRRGDIAAAREHLRRSIERAGAGADRGARTAALNSLALLERAAGNLEDALDLTDEAIRRCAAIGDRHREAALRNNRADLLQALGRRSEAMDELRRSVTAFAEVGDRPLSPEIWKLVDW